MKKDSNKEKEYVLRDGVSVYYNGKDEVRFRKGIWNYEEANINLNGIDESLRKNLIDAIDAFMSKKSFAIPTVNPETEEILDNVFSELENQRFIVSPEANKVQELIKDMIGGTVSEYMANQTAVVRPVLFLTDNKRLIKYAELTSEDLNMNLSFLDESAYKKLEETDITNRTEYMESVAMLEELKRTIQPYSCVVIAFEKPHLNFLRNINRVLLETETPVVITLLDGPFLSLVTLKPGETACYECFENRIIARNEEMTSYSEFVSQNRGSFCIDNRSTLVTPVLQTFVSFALFEAFLLATIGKSKIAGRVVNVYIPILEIQIQDLMRIPYCPACGHISKAKYMEMYSSSKRAINSMVDKIELTKNGDNA